MSQYICQAYAFSDPTGPDPMRESCGLSWIEGEEFHPEISLEGCPICEAVYSAQMPEHLGHIG